jgi:hypothetical protein
LGQFKTDARRIAIPGFHIVDGQGEAGQFGEFGCDRFAKVSRESCDTALTRQVVADKGNSLETFSCGLLHSGFRIKFACVLENLYGELAAAWLILPAVSHLMNVKRQKEFS